MKFQEATDTWFDDLASVGHFATSILEDADKILAMVPTKANLKRLIKVTLERAGMFDEALVHAKAVLAKKFKSEFRYSFNRVKGQCSAASEFFSLFRQALHYGEE